MQDWLSGEKSEWSEKIPQTKEEWAEMKKTMSKEDWAEWKKTISPEDWAAWKKDSAKDWSGKKEEMSMKQMWAEWKKKMTPEDWDEWKKKMTPHDWEVYKQKIEDTWGEWKGKDWDFEKPDVEEWKREGMRHAKNHVKRFAKKGRKFTHHAKRWMDKQMGGEEHEKHHPRKIWLDTLHEEDDSEQDNAPIMKGQEDEGKSHCPIRALKEKIKAFFAKHQQFVDVIVYAVLKWKQTWAEVTMAASLGASNFISFNHHELCKDAPTEFKTEDAYYMYQSEAPIQSKLCTENMSIAVNYLAFLVSLPAWSAQNDYRNLAFWLGDNHYNENANQVVEDALGYASYATYAAEAAQAALN